MRPPVYFFKTEDGEAKIPASKHTHTRNESSFSLSLCARTAHNNKQMSTFGWLGAALPTRALNSSPLSLWEKQS